MSLVISTLCCVIVASAMLVTSEQLLHWFLVPVTACGILIGIDAVDWLRGRCHIFDPQAVLGLLGVHFFFLAPLFHVQLDYWMRFVAPPSDWRPWLGVMACLNFVGLLIYRAVRAHVFRRRVQLPLRRWEIIPGRFTVLLVGFLCLSAGLQVYIYYQFGGIGGYVMAYERGAESFEGMGWAFTFSERFPIIALMGYAVMTRRTQSATTVLVLLVIFGGTAFLFGGLRGSRSNTIWMLFWATGIIHAFVRPLSRKLLITGLVFVFGFMHVYSFYKSGGSDLAMAVLQDRADIRDVEESTGRTIQSTTLADLGRADVQAFIVYRLATSDEYDLAWGRTYLASVTMLVPRSIWPSRPPLKVKEGTEIQRGRSSYAPEAGGYSSRVYGLTGEAMLNFGVGVAPFAFIFLGFVVGRIRALMARLEPDDARWLLIPLFVNLCFLILGMDSDNVIFFMIKNGALPTALVIFSVARHLEIHQ